MVSVLMRQSPHGATSWRLDDDAWGPDWTKTFLFGRHNLVENDVIITDFSEPGARPWRNFTPPLPCRGSFLLNSSSWSSTSIFFAVLASLKVTSRRGITTIFICNALGQVVSSNFPLPWTWLKEARTGRTLSILFLCARLSASRPAKFPLCSSFPHRYRSLLLLLPVLACSDESATTGLMWRNFEGLSFFAVQLASASQLAPFLYASQHFGAVAVCTSNKFPLLCSTFSRRCDAAPP